MLQLVMSTRRKSCGGKPLLPGLLLSMASSYCSNVHIMIITVIVIVIVMVIVIVIVIVMVVVMQIRVDRHHSHMCTVSSSPQYQHTSYY